MATALFVAARIIANPVSNVFQKLLGSLVMVAGAAMIVTLGRSRL